MLTDPSLALAWQTAWPWTVAAFVATVIVGRLVLGWLRRRQIVDLPNDRSSHTVPTPRGGGLATTPVLVLALLGFGWADSAWQLQVLGTGALALMLLSWWDDRHSLPPLPRFLAHGCAIAVFLALLPAHWLVFQGVLPVPVDRLLTLLAWLWFVNLYNFMDGIDGITGVQTCCLGVGIALVSAAAGLWGLLPPALIIAAVGAGFLIFNWHPAKMFLGDSGSIPFGFVLGGLLVWLAAEGQILAALVLPAYYLADSTITLIRRAVNGEKVWQAHRKHYYQRAVRGGRSHSSVSLLVLCANVVLVGAALLAVNGLVLASVLMAAATVAGVLTLMQVWAGPNGAFHPPNQP